MDLAFGRHRARDRIRDLAILPALARVQARDDALAIVGFAILTHLPFAFETRDGEAEAHDAAQHDIDVSLGRIGHRPRRGFARLLLVGQFADVAAQPVLVLHHLGTAVGVHDRIIPGRHRLCVQRFRRIPVGRDVALGALKDHQRLVARGEILPVRIGTREMAFDHAVGAVILQHRRQMGAVEPGQEWKIPAPQTAARASARASARHPRRGNDRAGAWW